MKLFKKMVALAIVLVMTLSVSYSFVGCKKKGEETPPSTNVETPDEKPDGEDPLVIALTSAQAKALVAAATDKVRTISLANIIEGEPSLLISASGSTSTQKIGSDIYFALDYSLSDIGSLSYSTSAKSLYDRTQKSGAMLIASVINGGIDINSSEFYTNSNGRFVEVDNIKHSMTYANAVSEKTMISEKTTHMYANSIMNGIAKILKNSDTKTTIANLDSSKISGSTLDGVSTISINLGTALQSIANLPAENDLQRFIYNELRNLFEDTDHDIDYVFFNSNYTARNFTTKLNLTVKDDRFVGYSLTQTYNGSDGRATISFSSKFDEKSVDYASKDKLGMQRLSSVEFIGKDIETEISKLKEKYTETNRPTVEDGLYNVTTVSNDSESMVFPVYVYTVGGVQKIVGLPMMVQLGEGDVYRIEIEEGKFDIGESSELSMTEYSQYVFADLDDFTQSIIGKTNEGNFVLNGAIYILENEESVGVLRSADVYSFMQKVSKTPVESSKFADVSFIYESGESTLLTYNENESTVTETKAENMMTFKLSTQGGKRFITAMKENGETQTYEALEYQDYMIVFDGETPLALATFGSDIVRFENISYLQSNASLAKKLPEIFRAYNDLDPIRMILNVFVSDANQNPPTYRSTMGNKTTESFEKGLYKIIGEGELFFTVSKNSSGITELKGVAGSEITYDPSTKMIGVPSSGATYTLLGNSHDGYIMYALKRVIVDDVSIYTIETIIMITQTTNAGITPTSKTFDGMQKGLYQIFPTDNAENTLLFIRNDASFDNEEDSIKNLSVESYFLSDTDAFIYNTDTKVLTIYSFSEEKDLGGGYFDYVRSYMSLILIGESVDGKTVYAYCFDARDMGENVPRFQSFTNTIVEIKKYATGTADIGDSFDYDYTNDRTIKTYIGLAKSANGEITTLQMDVVRDDDNDGDNNNGLLYFNFMNTRGETSKFISQEDDAYYMLRDTTTDEVAGLMLPIVDGGEIIGFRLYFLYGNSETRYFAVNLFDVDDIDRAEKALLHGEYLMTHSDGGKQFFIGSSGTFSSDTPSLIYNTNSRAIEWDAYSYVIIGRFYDNGKEMIVVKDGTSGYEILYRQETIKNVLSIRSTETQSILGKIFVYNSDELTISKLENDYFVTLKRGSNNVTLKINDFAESNMLFYGSDTLNRGNLNIIKNRNGSITIEIMYFDMDLSQPIFGILQGSFTAK